MYLLDTLDQVQRQVNSSMWSALAILMDSTNGNDIIWPSMFLDTATLSWQWAQRHIFQLIKQKLFPGPIKPDNASSMQLHLVASHTNVYTCVSCPMIITKNIIHFNNLNYIGLGYFEDESYSCLGILLSYLKKKWLYLQCSYSMKLPSAIFFPLPSCISKQLSRPFLFSNWF